MITISKEDFEKYLGEIGNKNNNLEDLIKIHKSLIGKVYGKNIDCAIRFISKLFAISYGQNYPYSYTKGASDFIKSKYLSDYFKAEIKKVIKDSDNIIDSLDSVKLINDMCEKEIKEIMDAINKYYKHRDGTDKSELLRFFEAYLYNLDGKGVISYLKNNIHPRNTAFYILESSGVCSEAGYLSGRGANLRDLNDEHLIAIFNKLLVLDINYALEFVKMVDGMEILGGTEFIETFHRFVRNKFVNVESDISTNNISLEGLHGGTRDIVAVASIISAKNRNRESEITLTKLIKSRFMQSIEPKIDIIDPNFMKSLRETRLLRLRRTK